MPKKQGSRGEHRLVRNCFVCGRVIQSAMDRDEKDPAYPFDDPPSRATCWVTRGNYGSTVFDPHGTDEMLEMIVCDDCLKRHADRVVTFRRDTFVKDVQRGIA